MVVVFPVLRICFAKVNYHAAFAVNTAGARVNIACLLNAFSVSNGIGVVFSEQISRDNRLPYARGFIKRHLLCFNRLAASAVVVNINAYGVCLRRPNLKSRLVLCVSRTQVVAVISKLVKLCGIRLVVGCANGC